MTMGEKILNLRKARGWSQEELAEQIGVTRQAVSRWESGAAKPDTDKVIAICDLFGVSADYLLRDQAYGTAQEPIRQEVRTGNALTEYLRSLTLFQWGAWGVMIVGGLVVLILHIVYIVSDTTYYYSDFWRSWSGFPAFIRTEEVDGLYHLALVGLVGGAVVIFGKPLMGAIKQFFHNLWEDIYTCFNGNG